MKITVTYEHIKNGRRRSAVFCPIANALNEKLSQLPNLMGIYVSPTHARIEITDDIGNPQYYNILFPHTVIDIIRQFDDDEEITPFEFESLKVTAPENIYPYDITD